jgi:PAS domain S-box-containing protein
MTPYRNVQPETDADLARMRNVLEESADVCRAIAGGEVDAFVVGDDNSRRVLLLATAYQRYRQLVERMAQGAVTVTGQGNILYANQKFAEMLEIPLAQLYTAPLEAYVGVGERARLSSFLMLSARNSQVELALNRRDGATLPVRISLATSSDGYATLLVTDLRPLHWPSLTVDALDSIRDSLEKLNHSAVGRDATASAALERISEEINGLARMIDEMLDVEGRAARG